MAGQPGPQHVTILTTSGYRGLISISLVSANSPADSAPSGGKNWVPFSLEAEWDGVTSDGETIPAWRQYRTKVLRWVQRG